MFKDFNLSKFKKLKPTSNNSFDTTQEIKALNKIPINKNFVKKYDDIEKVFAEVAYKNNIKDYDADLVGKLITTSAPAIKKLKNHFNRPRPKALAKKMNIKMKDYEMESMKTPSYPSGHSTQGVLISLALSDKHPKAKKDFKQAAKNISDSRNIAHAHYKSDSKMGEKLGKEMYNYIKNKI